MNGNMLYSKLGTYNNDNVIGKEIPISISLKKFISSNKFIIIPKQKKIKLILKIILISSLAKYLLIVNVLNIFFKINFHI